MLDVIVTRNSLTMTPTQPQPQRANKPQHMRIELPADIEFQKQHTKKQHYSQPNLSPEAITALSFYI